MACVCVLPMYLGNRSRITVVAERMCVYVGDVYDCESSCEWHGM